MTEPRWYCLFLLAALFARLSLGMDTISKYGCRGDSIELFENIALNNDDTVVSLYKNGVENMLIAVWSMQDSVRNSTLINGYNLKLFLDKYGNIWIHKLLMSDEAKYTVKIVVGSGHTDYEVQLIVLVAPTMHCKPKIIRVDNVLAVHLEANECGKPVASVYWLNHSGFSFEETKVIKLQPGKEAGIYHACIEGDALRCVKNTKSSDYCSFYKVDVAHHSPSQEEAVKSRKKTVQEQSSLGQDGDVKKIYITEEGNIPSESYMTTITFVMVTICLILLILGVVMKIVVPCLLRRKKSESDRLLTEGSTQTEQSSPDNVESRNETINTIPGESDRLLTEGSTQTEQSSPDNVESGNETINTIPGESDRLLTEGSTQTEQPSPGQEGPANVRNNAVEGESDRQLGNILSEEHTRSDQPKSAASVRPWESHLAPILSA